MRCKLKKMKMKKKLLLPVLFLCSIVLSAQDLYEAKSTLNFNFDLSSNKQGFNGTGGAVEYGHIIKLSKRFNPLLNFSLGGGSMSFEPKEGFTNNNQLSREYENTFYITSGVNLAPWIQLEDTFISFPIGIQAMYVADQKSKVINGGSKVRNNPEARFLFGPQVGISMETIFGLPFSVKYSYLLSSEEDIDNLGMWSIQWLIPLPD